MILLAEAKIVTRYVTSCCLGKYTTYSGEEGGIPTIEGKNLHRMDPFNPENEKLRTYLQRVELFFYCKQNCCRQMSFGISHTDWW